MGIIIPTDFHIFQRKQGNKDNRYTTNQNEIRICRYIDIYIIIYIPTIDSSRHAITRYMTISGWLIGTFYIFP